MLNTIGQPKIRIDFASATDLTAGTRTRYTIVGRKLAKLFAPKF